MFTDTQQQRADQIAFLWLRIEAATPGTRANRLTLGMYFAELRDLYSDRNCGGHRLTSEHGSFENEIRLRGYKPRTVREWIEDYVACLQGRATSAAKRRAQRVRRPVKYIGPLADFAALLPFKALHTAYRAAAMVFHPDHGGDVRRMQLLNDAWALWKFITRSGNEMNSPMQCWAEAHARALAEAREMAREELRAARLFGAAAESFFRKKMEYHFTRMSTAVHEDLIDALLP